MTNIGQLKQLQDRVKQLQEQINNTQPTTGLLGRWAIHPEYGDVLIAEDRASDRGGVYIVYPSDDTICGALDDLVPISDLTFPEQTTRPQDVSVGEAWLINAQDSTYASHDVAALKIGEDLWVSGDYFEWTDDEVELIAPLIPTRSLDTDRGGLPETVTTEEEYEALPEGSVVAEPGRQPWTHLPHSWAQWAQGGNTTSNYGGVRDHALCPTQGMGRMTTNHQRAVETLNKHWGVAKETGMADETECCVKALEAAGLLAPDTPESGGIRANEAPVWRADRCLMTTVVEEFRPVRMWIPSVGELAYSPQDARQQAHMLLAAANRAEQEEQ